LSARAANNENSCPTENFSRICNTAADFQASEQGFKIPGIIDTEDTQSREGDIKLTNQ